MHNHPSGDPTPSHAGIEMTKAIVAVAKPLGIAVHDHIIVGKDGHASQGTAADVRTVGRDPLIAPRGGATADNGAIVLR